MHSLVIPKYFGKNLLVILPLQGVSFETVGSLLEHWSKWVRVLGGSLLPIAQDLGGKEQDLILEYAPLYESFIYLDKVVEGEKRVLWGEIYKKVLELKFQFILQLFDGIYPEEINLQLLWDHRVKNNILGGVWSGKKQEFRVSFMDLFRSIWNRCPVNFMQTPFLLYHAQILELLLQKYTQVLNLPNVSFFANLIRVTIKEVEFIPFIPLEIGKFGVRANPKAIKGPFDMLD